VFARLLDTDEVITLLKSLAPALHGPWLEALANSGKIRPVVGCLFNALDAALKAEGEGGLSAGDDAAAAAAAATAAAVAQRGESEGDVGAECDVPTTRASIADEALAGFNVSAEDETDFDEDASQAGSDPSVPNEEGQGGSKLDGAMDELTDTLYEVLHNSALRAGHEPRGVAEFVRWIFRDLLSVIRAPDVAAAFDIQALLSPLSEEQRAAALSAGSRLLSADGEAEAGAEGELPPLQLQREPPPDADAALQPLLESFKKQFSLALQQIGKAALEPPPPAAAAAADAASAAAAGAQSEVVFLEVSHGEADSATLAANGYERISAVANKEATAALGGSALWVKRRNRCVGVPSARGSPSAVPPVAGIALSTARAARSRKCGGAKTSSVHACTVSVSMPMSYSQVCSCRVDGPARSSRRPQAGRAWHGRSARRPPPRACGTAAPAARQRAGSPTSGLSSGPMAGRRRRKRPKRSPCCPT